MSLTKLGDTNDTSFFELFCVAELLFPSLFFFNFSWTILLSVSLSTI
ncbi:hypothetical protein [Sulfolobus spindle-shaped virus]|nr:hypothetical protein [Sulfolobus spindle-shaped virus]